MTFGAERIPSITKIEQSPVVTSIINVVSIKTLNFSPTILTIKTTALTRLIQKL